MTRILDKIKDPVEEVRKINENFDRLALDISDRSGVFSSVGNATVPVSAGSAEHVEINIIDNLNIYQSGKMPVIPRVDVYIDNDSNSAYIYPEGSSLTAANKYNLSVEVITPRTVRDPATNEKATCMVVLRNRDASPHTFYVYADVYYVPPPELGVAVRPINAG